MVNKNKYKIQTLIFDKRYYRTKSQVKRWIKNNPDFKLIKYKRRPVAEDKISFMVRQREPWFFKQKTLKTMNLNKTGTIKAVKGKLK